VILTEGFGSDLEQNFLGKEFRLLDRYELQDLLVETLKKTKYHKRQVPACANCHRMFRHWRCRNNHDFAQAEKSCSLRVCPHCCRRRSLMLAGKMESFLVGKPMNTLRYAVLSERNCVNLVAGMALLWEAWTRLRRFVAWKAQVKGCIVALEVTRNAKDNTWHPHLNVLMEGDYFPVEKLRQMWMEATEFRSETAFIRAADAGTVRELIKYVTKLTDLIGDPEALDDFLTAVYKKRLVRTCGSFYCLKMDDEEAPRLQQCPDCESTELVKLGMVAPQKVSMDLKGVLRVTRLHEDMERDLHQAILFRTEKFRPKADNYFPRVKKRWDKKNLTFEERHAEWNTAAEWFETKRADLQAAGVKIA
jgi:hypothetical protein